MPTQRLTVTTELPREVTPAARAATFALEPLEPSEPLGVAVVCPDARYASARWRGEDRPTRLHLTPAEWRAVAEELEIVTPDLWVNGGTTLVRVVTAGRAHLRCVAITELKGDPWALTAALDALLGQRVGETK